MYQDAEKVNRLLINAENIDTLWLSDKEMAPAVLVTSRSPAHKESLMDKASVAYVLCRIEDESSLTPVSEHEDIAAGVAAGEHRVEVKDLDFSYGLYAGGVRMGSFAEGRIGYREWACRSGRLSDNMMEPFPERPKGMHHDTYMRLVWEHNEAEMAQLAGMREWIDRMEKKVG
jgi:hypothetical protein